MKTKQCTKCNKKKDIKHFFKRAATADGLNPWCRDCDREYKQNRRAAKSSGLTSKKLKAPSTKKTKPVKPTRKKSKLKS